MVLLLELIDLFLLLHVLLLNLLLLDSIFLLLRILEHELLNLVFINCIEFNKGRLSFLSKIIFYFVWKVSSSIILRFVSISPISSLFKGFITISIIISVFTLESVFSWIWIKLIWSFISITKSILFVSIIIRSVPNTFIFRSLNLFLPIFPLSSLSFYSTIRPLPFISRNTLLWLIPRTPPILLIIRTSLLWIIMI